MSGPHPYSSLSLFWVGLLVGVYLIGLHLFLMRKPELCKAWLKKLPRHHQAGMYVLSVGMFWFWLLVAPDNLGFLSSLTMDIGEFNGMKPWLRILVPAALVGMVTCAREFLFVRGLGVVALMAASPILEAAQFKEPSSRLLLVAFAYILLTKGMFWVGMPYTFRDAVTWATANDARWKLLVRGGLVYGLLVLLCALMFWRGY